MRSAWKSGRLVSSTIDDECLHSWPACPTATGTSFLEAFQSLPLMKPGARRRSNASCLACPGRISSVPALRDAKDCFTNAWFRAVPVDKFVYRVIVRSLAAFRSQGVQYGRLRLFEIGKGKGSLRRFPLSPVFGHSGRPPAPPSVRMPAYSILGRYRRSLPSSRRFSFRIARDPLRAANGPL